MHAQARMRVYACFSLEWNGHLDIVMLEIFIHNELHLGSCY
jgi:hypothetical protein